MRARRGWLRCDRCRTAWPTLDATVTPTLVLCRSCASVMPASPTPTVHPRPTDRYAAPVGCAPPVRLSPTAPLAR